MRRLLKQVDLETGELLDGVVVQVAGPRRNGFERWVAMAQEPMSELARAKLGQEAYRVFLALVGQLGFDNVLMVSQSALARELGMRRQNVHRALEQLIAVGVLLDGPRIGVHRGLRLNPRYGWKGSASGHRKVLRLDVHRARAGKGSSGGSPGEPVRA